MVAQAAGGEDAHKRLAGKEYKKAVESLCRSSAMRVTDLDQKVIALLDALQEKGRAAEACEYLRTQIEGIEREKVHSWRAYSYSLLRKFDQTIYLELKGQKGEKSVRSSRAARTEARPKVEKQPTTEGLGVGGGGGKLNPLAAEFVPAYPGYYWPLPAYPAPAYPAPPVVPATKAPSGNAETVKLAEATKPVDSAAVSTDAGSGNDKEDAKEAPAARPTPPEGGFELGSAEMPSAGSSGHWEGTCKPCAFFGTKGCTSGMNCGFCHLCGPDEKKRRKKEKQQRTPQKS